MSDSGKFIKDYGSISFTEMPFCDVDNITLCQISYLPLEKTAPNSLDDEPESFTDVYNKYFEFCGNKHKAVGLVLPKGISVQAMEMANTKRYSEMKIIGARETFQVSPAVQFAAATFLLPDGTIVVMFRGTDDSLIGWVEDMDIYTRKGIPSHQLAVDYLNEVGKKFEGEIIVCGHSKGGNVALYGALNCDQEVRDRIRTLYNNDGPGFYNYDFLDTPAYKELLPRYRHFIPDSSLVGVLLAHDDDYQVVKSKRITGPAQHDMASWRIEGTELVQRDGLTPIGKFNDIGFSNLVFKLTDEQSLLLENVVEEVIKGTGELYILGFLRHFYNAMNGAAKAWTGLDNDTRSSFKEVFKGTGKLFGEAAKLVRSDTLPVVKKRLQNIRIGLFA